MDRLPEVLSGRSRTDAGTRDDQATPATHAWDQGLNATRRRP